MEVNALPFVNARLNALSGTLLLAGYVCIRRGHKTAPARLMIAAFFVSTIFLGCYLTYHYLAGHKPYEGEGFFRTIYFLILISHIILAALVVPMVLRTVYLAWKQRWETHRWWGRMTFPIWMYVSVTGVIVYNMLY